MRFAHRLRENKSVAMPHSAVWVDTETRPKRRPDGTIEHWLAFGWCCFRRTRKANEWCESEWHRFTTPSQFWSIVEARCRPHTRTYIFAHNWAFDAPVLQTFDVLRERGWQMTKTVVESPPVIMTWCKPGLSITMLDTLNWWRMPLKSVGKSLGLPKLEMPPLTARKKEWDTYAKRDVEIIERVCLEWWEFLVSHDLGSFAPTLASQALRAFRHRFMDHDILIDNNLKALTLARESLHGGRTEAFRLGKIDGPIYVLDVNSMYPFVMRDNMYPTALRMHARISNVRELTKWLKDWCVIARVRLQTKRPRYAITQAGKVMFPIGRIETCLTTPDLIDAVEHDEIRSIIECSVYTRAPIFSRFVTELYAERQKAAAEGNTVRVWLLKILMNSLYGKFAQRGDVWETIAATQDNDIRVWKEIDADTGVVRNFRQFGGIVQQKNGERESLDSSPAIAAHVTAYARAQLWNLMLTAEQQNVFYCDTDSLFVNDDGRMKLSHFINPSTLGALKEESVHQWILIHGLKDYVTPVSSKTKGAKANAKWLAPNVLEQEQWSSLPGLIRSGDVHAPTTKTVRKTLRRTYDKGIVSPCGDVSPLVVRHW